MATPCVGDTDCISLDIDPGGLLTANPIVAPVATNGIECRAGSGLYAPGRPLFVSALPALPADGDEVFYKDASWTNGEVWHLRYNAASASSYKWEYLGGSALYTMILAAEGRNNNAAYAALGTPVEIVLPANVGGDWEIEHGCVADTDTDGQAAKQAVKLGAAAGTDNESVWNSSGRYVSVQMMVRAIGIAGGATLALVYATGNCNATFRRRWLSVRPVRLG